MLQPKHQCCKALGQNFLIDDVIINQIIDLIAPKNNELIIEIGPGLGALTDGLVRKSCKLIAVEIDRNLTEKLNKIFHNELLDGKLLIINQDILKFDLLNFLNQFAGNINIDLSKNSGNEQIDNCNRKLRIVGNLPYNISSPLLFKIFNYSKYIKDCVFMLQKEFAERLVAKPNTKQYGRLSVMAQYHAAMNIVFNVPARSFKPVPKVTSSVISIKPYAKLPYVSNNYQIFQELVTVAFSQRRKILSNSLRKYCSEELLIKLNINPLNRPEQLEGSDFIKISNAINKI